MKKDYRRTLTACYLGFITQAITANFAPLVFLTFHKTYQISLGRIALIPTMFFFTQLLVDLFCAKFVDRIGYRRCVIASELFSAAGLIGLAVLPDLLPDPYAGILVSVVIYAMGSGLIEVLVSPIVEACPFENKSSVMSLLHSFYCWGSVGVILFSTVFFALFGVERWRILACLWAVIPLYNVFNFAVCPIERLTDEGQGLGIRGLFGLRAFWVAIVLMVCAGASELSMSQWASAYVEAALGLPKSVGDSRPLPVCRHHGRKPPVLWEIRRKGGFDEIHGWLRGAVPCVLSAGVAGRKPGAGAAGLRAVRLLRGDHVAGHHQHHLRRDPHGRYRHVCPAGHGR